MEDVEGGGEVVEDLLVAEMKTKKMMREMMVTTSTMIPQNIPVFAWLGWTMVVMIRLMMILLMIMMLMMMMMMMIMVMMLMVVMMNLVMILMMNTSDLQSTL